MISLYHTADNDHVQSAKTEALMVPRKVSPRLRKRREQESPQEKQKVKTVSCTECLSKKVVWSRLRVNMKGNKAYRQLLAFKKAV